MLICFWKYRYYTQWQFPLPSHLMKIKPWIPVHYYPSLNRFNYRNLGSLFKIPLFPKLCLWWYYNFLLLLTWSSFPYKIGRFDPSTPCIIRACIGMPFFRTVSSNPTIRNAVRPRVERARLMLRPLTCSAFLMSAKKHKSKLW